MSKQESNQLSQEEELLQIKVSQFKHKIALQLVPIMKIGDQVITFTYATSKYIKHYVFPLSLALFEKFWFIDSQKRIELFQLYYKHFLYYIKQNKETDERYDFQQGLIPKLNIYLINEMQENNNIDIKQLQHIFLETTVQVFDVMDLHLDVNSNKITRLQYQFIDYNDINYESVKYNQLFLDNQEEIFTKQILCELYVVNGGSRYQVPQFQTFRYQRIHKRDEIHNTLYCFGEVQLNSSRNVIGRFPLPLINGDINEGEIVWLITGQQFNQDELFIGIGWINGDQECNEDVFIVLLDSNMLYPIN